MNRIVITNPFPCAPDTMPADTLVITPHAAAANALGVRNVSLRSLALRNLKKAGFTIASEFEAFEYLKRSITAVEPNADSIAMATRVRKILRTLLRTGVDVDELESRGSSQVKQLARIAREYQHQLEERALVDNSAALWRAAFLEPERVPLYVYGYFRARKEEVAFINSLAGDGSVYFLPCGDDPIFEVNNRYADFLVSPGGWTRVSDDDGSTSSVGARAARRFVESTGDAPVRAYSLHNIESEVRFVLAKMKGLLRSGVHAEEIAIVSRDLDTYAPLISEVSAEYGFATELRYKVELSRTLFGSFVECLLAANENDYEFETTAALLMHPFGPGLTANEWKTARKDRVRGAEQWSTLSPHLSCLTWGIEGTWSEWVNCLVDTLQRFSVRKKSATITREILAYNAFVEALATLTRDSLSVVSQFEFFNTVREILASSRVSFQPSRGGVPVHDLNTIQGASYKHLFVVGMAEGILPASVVDNAVVDFFERAALVRHGIDFEEAAEVARWSALSFYFALIAGVESLTLTHPLTIGDGHKIQSPYLGRLGISKSDDGELTEISCSAEELRLLLRSDTIAGESLDRARDQLRVEAVRESIELADEYDGVIGIPVDPTTMSWSASQFTVLGQCPYRWFAQKVLKLKPAEEAEISLSPALKGSLYHKVLELAADRARESEDFRQGVLDVLDECFAIAESDPELGLPAFENWPLQRHEHLRALRRAVMSPSFIEEGATVLSAEEAFDANWNGLQVRGRIDRVDRTASGLVAIDYKTSSSVPQGVKNENRKTNVDIQLAVYSQIALKHLYPEEEVAKGLYYSLTKGTVLKSIDGDEMPSMDDVVAGLHGLLSEGHFAVDPDIDGNACKYCEFDAMCRKGTRLARKTRS